MALRIAEATAADLPAVRAMNARLKAAGSSWGFYDRATPEWLAPVEGDPLWRRHLLARNEEAGTIHGGYVLKQQPFRLDGADVLVGHVQGPVSEGLVDRRFGLAGPLMLRDSLARLPLQIGWGTSNRKAELLRKSGWKEWLVPLLFDPVRPAAVLKGLAEAGQAPAALAQGLSATGLATLAASGWRLTALLAGGTDPSAVAIPSEPGDWLDALWRQARDSSRLVAVRDTASTRRLLSPRAWPGMEVLRVERHGRVIGFGAWRAQLLERHPRYGSIRAASIVDALAVPGEVPSVARAIADHARRAPVDLVVAAFSHPAWTAAFRAAGYVATAPRRRLLLSPALAMQLGSGPANSIHLTMADGDGPLFFGAAAA